MDDHIVFARTERGREELLGADHALKPRPRQVLFLVGEAISVGDLRAKLPTCQELDGILEQLWEEGYIGQVKPSVKANSQGDVNAALSLLRGSRLEAARSHALGILTNLVGDKSPAYHKVKEAQDAATFTAALASARKILAAVASATQAAAFESGALAILNLPASGEVPAAPSNPNPAKMNGIESAKGHALEIVRSLVGEKSPVYMKLDGCHNRAEFMEAINAGKKVIAAVASSAKAKTFETEVMARLSDHH